MHRDKVITPARCQGGIRKYFLEEVMLKLNHEQCCTIRWSRKKKEFQREWKTGSLCSCVFLVPMPAQCSCWKYTPVWLAPAKTPSPALMRLLKAASGSEYPQLLTRFSLNRKGLWEPCCSHLPDSFTPFSFLLSFLPFLHAYLPFSFLFSSNIYCVHMCKPWVVLGDTDGQNIFLTLKELKIIQCVGSKLWLFHQICLLL